MLAIVAALSQAGPITLFNGTEVTRPTGVSIDRSKKKPISREELNRISVYRRDNDPTPGGHERSNVTDNEFRVACHARVDGTDDKLDPLQQWITATVLTSAALRALTLSVKCVGENFEVDEDSQGDYSEDMMTFEIRYQASKYDLTAQA